MTQKDPVGGLLVTHGALGVELVAAARTIVGEAPHIAALSIGWNDDVSDSKRKVEEALGKVNRGRGVIVLTDMFGGTPSNLALSFLKANDVEIVTGVNLPMVIKLANQSGGDTVSELALEIKKQGQRHISIASEVLEP